MLHVSATVPNARKVYQLCVKHRLPVPDALVSVLNSNTQACDIPGFSFQLKEYQAQGVAYLERWDGNVLLADEPGLGKTAQVMAYAWQNRRFPMLVVLPKTLLLNWRREITLMLGSQLSVLIVGFVPSKKRQAQLRAQWPHVSFSRVPQPGYDVTLINYDIVERNLAALEAQNYDYVVADESHKIKNPKAHRTQAFLRLVTGREEIPRQRGQFRQVHDAVPHVTFCTGTPMLNRPVELWTTVNTLAGWVPQFENFFNFASKFCNAHKTRWGWDFNGSSNEAEINTLLTETCMLRRLKQDVLKDLPPKTFVTVPLEFDRAEYDAVAAAFEGSGAWKQGMETLVRHGGNAAKSDEAIVALGKCREIAAYAKLDNAVEWIMDFVEQGEKLVVFAHHQRMVDQVAERLAAANIGVRVIRGGVSLEQRAQAAQDFQTRNDVQVIVLNIASAGFGITLTAARACAFLQLPWTPGDLIQAADRVHRIGQQDNVTVYNLVAEGTVEEDMGELIMSKAAVSNAVVDGGANRELADLNLGK